MLTCKEVAEIMRVDRQTVYQWIKTGRIPYIKIGSSIRIPEDFLKEVKNEN